MFKKKQKETNAEELKLDEKDTDLEPHNKPMVFLFDFEEEVEKRLKELRINYHSGSFGATVKVANKIHDKKYLTLNHDYPPNLHEFDVVMLDLTTNKTENYDPAQHPLSNISGGTAHALLSTFPEQTFDPRPLSINLVSSDINEFSEKKSIVVAFCGRESSAEYDFVQITDAGTSVTRKQKNYSNFSFYEHFPSFTARYGVKTSLPEKESKLTPLFSSYLDKISYQTVFNHPTIWKDGRYQKSDNFIPLLFNERKEIISFAHFVEEAIFLIFPDVADKPSFISELFRTYLPEIVPELFPYHGEFKWLDGGDYPLPGENELLQKRAELEEQYNRDIAKNEENLASLKTKFRFLSDLITETGGVLVTAVEAYLKWLEFESVVNLDDTNPDILEEDIQVDCNDRFLVIEIKGIGGTSTDKDCSQISKIRYRRAEQRRRFDVFGLYIVNHQRYMPPKSRTNPPFTDNQIIDAGHDNRGLLTTYNLYKAYFLIEKGILQKADVRESLFKTGLITLEPENITSIGIPHELIKDGQVAIINLNDTALAVGDTLIVRKHGDYSKATIKSMQINDKGVNSCNTGEVGIKFDRKLKKNSELFVRKV
jgi:hypothetical protein